MLRGVGWRYQGEGAGSSSCRCLTCRLAKTQRERPVWSTCWCTGGLCSTLPHLSWLHSSARDKHIFFHQL